MPAQIATSVHAPVRQKANVPPIPQEKGTTVSSTGDPSVVSQTRARPDICALTVNGCLCFAISIWGQREWDPLHTALDGSGPERNMARQVCLFARGGLNPVGVPQGRRARRVACGTALLNALIHRGVVLRCHWSCTKRKRSEKGRASARCDLQKCAECAM